MTHGLPRNLDFGVKLLLVGAGCASLTFGQTQSPAATPQFEVVSIKFCKEVPPGRGDGWGGGRVRVSPGRLTAECQTMEKLIKFAYLWFANGKPLAVSSHTGLRIPPVSQRQLEQPIKGIPAWMNSSHFTIDAKAESAVTAEMMQGPMMRALLEDRFRLKIHRESIEVPVYDLTVARGGPKFKAAKEGGCAPRDPDSSPRPLVVGQAPSPVFCGSLIRSERNDGFDLRGETMADLCRQLSAWLDRDVIDKTGMAGTFDLHLGITVADLLDSGESGDGFNNPAAPAIPRDLAAATMTAASRLGLALKPSKGLSEILVIDHVERPSQN